MDKFVVKLTRKRNYSELGDEIEIQDNLTVTANSGPDADHAVQCSSESNSEPVPNSTVEHFRDVHAGKESSLESESVTVVVESKEKETRSAYAQVPWLTTVKGGWLCGICSKQYTNGTLFVDLKRTGGVWVITPFAKQKSRKLSEKAAQHAQSQMHRLATQKDQHVLGDIQHELLRQHISRDETTAVMIKKLINCALYLFLNEIPHTTQWSELLSLISLVAPDIHAWLSGRPANAHYMSSTD
jgi:hypothetical protein